MPWHFYTEHAGSQNISLFLNNGDGTFANFTVLPFNDKPYSIVAADLDGDGDMAAVQLGANKIGYLLNNGDGTFTAFQTIDVGNGPWGIVSADLNGDGKLDLAVANSGIAGDTASIVLNQ